MKVHASQKGFALIELVLAIGIATVISTVLLSITLTYYGNVIQNNQTAELAIESHYALRAVIEDIRLADSIPSTNTLSDANKVGGWATSDASNVLIIASPATTSANDVIYDPDSGYPYRNELIYFINGTSLHKRTLKNTLATGNSAKTSCPASAVSSACPVDKTYTTHITNLSFNYFDDTNVATTDPALARSVNVSVTLSRKAFGKTISYTNSIQTTLRNH